jgi:hypothetical protein
MILLKLLLHFPILQLHLCNLTCQLLPKEKSGFSETSEKNLSNTMTLSEKRKERMLYSCVLNKILTVAEERAGAGSGASYSFW